LIGGKARKAQHQKATIIIAKHIANRKAQKAKVQKIVENRGHLNTSILSWECNDSNTFSL